MLTLEQSTLNVIETKGLDSIPLEAFQFNWRKLYNIFNSTFSKFERFCPQVKTIYTNGGNPLIMPDDCIYPRAIGFGNKLMIPPQTVAVDRQNWSYDRRTKELSVFTRTNTVSSFQVQYLAKYADIKQDDVYISYNTLSGESNITIELDLVPEQFSINISKDNVKFELCSKDFNHWYFETDLDKAILNLTTLEINFRLQDASESTISISYTPLYPAKESPMDESLDFFETWYAANILSSLGNIKSVLRMDQLPNDINADSLASQGKELLEDVKNYQKDKQFWFTGYISARI